MITCQCAEAMPTYASQSSYLTPIPSANIERGVIPLDSLPADWWNWLWNNITLNEARIVQFINSVFSEINSVLSAAGVTPSTASTTDLKTAIQKLATTVATSAVPGSVLSSTLSGKLRVIADGTASINGLGTPDQLETTSKEVVSAINEVLTLAQGKAPTSHASSATTYGVGTTQQYGHVKVTEGCGLAISCGTISLNAPGYNCTGTVTAVCYNGTKYTPSSGVVNLGNAPSGFPGYGTAICALNGNLCCASSAGTSNLVARADHVHQMPSCIGNDGSYVCLTCRAANIVAYDCVSIRSNGRGLNIYANAYRYLVAEPISHGFRTVYVAAQRSRLCALHHAVGGNWAVGVGFCLDGLGFVEGLEWFCDQVVTILYRPTITCNCLRSTTLSPPEATVCTYCMGGILNVFQ